MADTFRLSHLVLGSVTYNLGIYPVMHNFLSDLKALNVQNRTVALVENGTWAIKSGELMQKELEGMKNMTILPEKLTIRSAARRGPRRRARRLRGSDCRFRERLTAEAILKIYYYR